ncbi:hypothetical protein [Agrobacterium tumefaciens]|uniref:hypothetical protein n=1 Tax=Agrobacterium tumefaciens TaxID=358 RepID=UPI003BA3678B
MQTFGRSSGKETEFPDGHYPFTDRRYPLAELTMIEMPWALEELLRAQAAARGVLIDRGQIVELRCQSAEYPDAIFTVYWPYEEDRLHTLAPKEFSKGRA